MRAGRSIGSGVRPTRSDAAGRCVYYSAWRDWGAVVKAAELTVA